jgi:hypothetical protein
MPKLEDFSYLFEETVTAVNDYYDFLTKVYIDESRILPSPEGGWPEITPERLEDLGKTDEIIKLLQYMP